MKICLFDPGLENNQGVPSANLGDLIIQEAVTRELNRLFTHGEFINIATHEFPTISHILTATSCPLIFVGGTNLLGSRMDYYKQWKVSLLQKIILRKAILFGVGWERYQVRPNLYTRISLRAALSTKQIHSVRDNYTKEKLESAGIKNVINTACPTMWPFIDMNCQDIPSEKSANVLLMLTDYSQSPELDQKLLELIATKYEKVFVWPQGRGDQKYVSSLVSNLAIPVVMLNHSYSVFNEFINSGVSFDYIGTRLHGGIKCLLAKKRSLIIEIDSRAKEIAKDTNLPTCEREDFPRIAQWIENPSKVEIKMPKDSINRWKSQFSIFNKI
ncbi:polysaccharide pyruvyl transferase family protein [Anabaena subtropica]|uniref:Polysaccharide pyruvyl transferase family protein n=1 Tax=Anabaena subtropica FACHB-260 TaxID=2692884 RepID=A0ABR8CQK0_9NOST|nr:polysaccharide pyruvyl transferase family protein [Anabaena subtropica]MBD2345475.1 polysaccharide pyruvyl transferase family protein [Anabaena subtropica FACHB-260]